MAAWSGRQLWIASIVVFELLALTYFVLHAPVIDESALHNVDVMRGGDARSSPNIRQCLSTRHRDQRFAHAARGCVTVHDRRKALLGLIYEAKVVFESLGIVYWLDSGSLLGQYQMGDVMLRDLDVDIGILREGLEALQSNELKLLDGYEVNVSESDVQSAHDRDVTIPARLVEKQFGFYVDIFVFRLETHDGQSQQPPVLAPPASASWISCVKCPSIPGTAPSVKQFVVRLDWILPTQPCVLGDYEVRCPAQPGPYLNHLYGDDFFKPKE